MQVQSLGWEDPLEEEMATPSSILVWEIPLTEEPGGYSPWGCSESDMITRARIDAPLAHRPVVLRAGPTALAWGPR